MNVLEELKHSFQNGSMLNRLILINVGIFLIESIVSVLFFLSTGNGFSLSPYLSVPENLNLLVQKPWTPLTYMFIHHDFWHLFMNLLVLYAGGKVFEQFNLSKRMLPLYLMGGLIGALFFVTAYNVFPGLTDDNRQFVALGSSASVLAIFIAVTAYQPNYSLRLAFLGPVKLKYIAGVLLLLDLVEFQTNTGGHLAHFGGAALGFWYGKKWAKGQQPLRWLESLIDVLVNWKPIQWKKRSKLKTVHKKSPSDYEYQERKADEKERLNEILDKISRAGYDSLSKDEKDFLFKAGK